MRRQALITLAAGLALACSAGTARAAHGPGFPQGCSFEHPERATKYQAQFVQAFVSCGNVGGNSPNATTEGGVPSCKPPETFNDQVGSPLTGWHFDPASGGSKVQFSVKTSPSPPAVSGGLNPPGNTVDLKIVFSAKGIVDTVGPANGTGALATVARATLQDRGADHIGNSADGDDADMTVVDFPANFPFTLVNGHAALVTSADALLNGIGQYGLPHCTSLEIVSLQILDLNGTPFASVGLFMP